MQFAKLTKERRGFQSILESWVTLQPVVVVEAWLHSELATLGG
jgi:hypothetical protein